MDKTSKNNYSFSGIPKSQCTINTGCALAALDPRSSLGPVNWHRRCQRLIPVLEHGSNLGRRRCNHLIFEKWDATYGFTVSQMADKAMTTEKSSRRELSATKFSRWIRKTHLWMDRLCNGLRGVQDSLWLWNCPIWCLGANGHDPTVPSPFRIIYSFSSWHCLCKLWCSASWGHHAVPLRKVLEGHRGYFGGNSFTLR